MGLASPTRHVLAPTNHQGTGRTHTPQLAKCHATNSPTAMQHSPPTSSDARPDSPTVAQMQTAPSRRDHGSAKPENPTSHRSADRHL